MNATPIKLYEYFRSSTSYRIRIALYLKNIAFESISVDLLKGEHKEETYKEINPQGVVPYFIYDDVEIAGSQAILEYLDDVYPDPLLLHGNAENKAYIRQMSGIISCEMHPFGNPKVWKGYLMGKKGFSMEDSMEWMHYWLQEGFNAYESFLTKYNHFGKFTSGDQVSMADLCLMPQLYNARRFGLPLDNYPNILKIEKNLLKVEAFQKASPESHADCPSNIEVIHGPNSALCA